MLADIPFHWWSKDLCTLCAVSHTIQREAEWVLYHTVQLQCEPTTLLWSHTITETPRLAKLVCSLTLSAAVHLDKCNILVAAFGAIINLKKLVILNLLGEWSSRSHFNPTSLKGCTFCLNVYHNQLDVPWDEYVKFLSEQPDFGNGSLSFQRGNQRDQIAQGATPSYRCNIIWLEYLEGHILLDPSVSDSAIAALVMIWNNTEEFLGDIIREICPFGQCLTHLNMDACSPLPCPWLQRLSLVTLQHTFCLWNFWDMQQIAWAITLDTAREYTPDAETENKCMGSLPFTVSIQHAWYPHDQLRTQTWSGRR